MPARQPVPMLWLMTDERADTTLEQALARLPRGSGIVFRHHATERVERRRRFEAVRRIARARKLVLVLAGEPRDTVGWRADGWHGPGKRRLPLLCRTAPAHDTRELVAAWRADVDVIFLSPAFATRSHPGTEPLGPLRFGLMANHRAPRAGRVRRTAIIALGGMDAMRYRRLAPLGADGWAAIDAWRS